MSEENKQANRPRDYHDVELRLAKLEGRYEATEKARDSEISGIKQGTELAIDQLKAEMDKRFSSVDEEFVGIKEKIEDLGSTVNSNGHKMLAEIQALAAILTTEKEKVGAIWKTITVVATVIVTLGGAIGWVISETSFFK